MRLDIFEKLDDRGGLVRVEAVGVVAEEAAVFDLDLAARRLEALDEELAVRRRIDRLVLSAVEKEDRDLRRRDKS